MLFSIPETTQVTEDNGSKYWVCYAHFDLAGGSGDIFDV